METVTFLRQVLPPLPPKDAFGGGPVYFSLGLRGKDRVQTPHSSIQTLIARASTLLTAGYNVYMAMGSFASPLAGRTQVNAHEIKSLWMDLDCGPGKPYPDAAHALADLLRFQSVTGIAPTIVVSSGRGIHAYIVFDKAIPAILWVKVAELFFQLCKQNNLHVDPARAKDSASVLRLPGTIHQSAQKIVHVVQDTGVTYSPGNLVRTIARQLRVVPRTVSAPVLPKISAASLGIAPPPPTADAKKIARNCRQIATMGTGLEPQWYGAMSVLKRCVDGRNWAHAFSATDPTRYDFSACEAKFSRAPEDSPMTCIKFAEINPPVCEACPHRGRITSPVQLSQIDIPVLPEVLAKQAAAPKTTAEPPASLAMLDTNRKEFVGILGDTVWDVDRRGIVWKEIKKDGNGGLVTHQHVICPVQIWFKYTAHRVAEGRHKTLHYWEAVYPNNLTREMVMIADEDMTEQNIMRWLRSADINPNGPAYGGRMFMGFFDAYLNSVRSVKKTVPIVKEFGWTRYNDPVTKTEVDGFVIGNGVVTETGVHPVGHDTGTTGIFAKDTFNFAGTLQNWKMVPRMYTALGQKLGEFSICCALAAPYMRYGIGEAKNAYLNLFSHSGGRGKSELARACHSVWGNPQRAFGSPNASASQRGKAMSVYNNLPFIVDEITRMKDSDMQDMVYILAGGTDKDRLTSKADLTRTGHWSTYTFSTANRSVKEALSRVTGDTDATLLRLVEYECDFSDYSGVPETQNFIRAVMDIRDINYGWAGPELVHFMLKNPVRLARLTSTLNAWRLKHGFKDNERFLASAVGIPLIIGAWAVEAGIVEFNMSELENWVLNVLVPYNRESTKELSPDFVNNLSVYLNFRHPNTICVTRDRRGTSEADPRASHIPDKYVLYRPYGEIVARYEKENEELKFSVADFKDWCSKRSISERVLLNDLRRRGVIIDKVRANLGTDISWLPTSRIWCYSIRTNGLRALGYQPPTVAPPPAVPTMPADPLSSLIMT